MYKKNLQNFPENTDKQDSFCLLCLLLYVHSNSYENYFWHCPQVICKTTFLENEKGSLFLEELWV